MTLKHLLVAIAGALGIAAASADTSFVKPEYRITLPGEWKDTSDREGDAFQNKAGTRELTVTVMGLKQAIDAQKLREVLTRLLELRAQAHREIEKSGATFDGPVFGVAGGYTTAQLWGAGPSGRRFVTTLFADPGGIRSFSYLASGTQEDAFRTEANRVFQRIELK